MRLHRTFLLLMVLLLTNFAMAQTVHTDYDRAATFSNYHTYAWSDGTPAKDQLMDQRIRDNIDQQRGAKGLQKVTAPDKADLLVAYAPHRHVPCICFRFQGPRSRAVYSPSQAPPHRGAYSARPSRPTCRRNHSGRAAEVPV
jgi:hypothetical protein